MADQDPLVSRLAHAVKEFGGEPPDDLAGVPCVQGRGWR